MEVPETQLIEAKNEGGVGPIIATIIVVILLALGGVYFLIQENARFHTPPVQENLNA